MHISHTFLMSFNEANHDWIESFILLSKLLNKSIFSCSIAASRRTWTRIKEKKCWSCSWSENNSRLALLPLRELRLEPMRSFGLNIFTQYCDNIVCTDCFIICWRWHRTTLRIIYFIKRSAITWHPFCVVVYFHIIRSETKLYGLLIYIIANAANLL